MNAILEQDYADFFARLNKIKNALVDPESHLLVDDGLRIVDKATVSWRMLCLARPFYALLGKDVYSHVRADLVAKSILRYCQANEEYFGMRSKACLELQLAILSALHAKTVSKYNDIFVEAIKGIQNRLTPNPQVRIWPADLTKLGITYTQKAQTDNTIGQVVPLLLKESSLALRSSTERYFEAGVCKKAKTASLVRLSPFLGRYEVLKKFEEPLRLSCMYSTSLSLTNIILHAERIIGKGGERTVKQSYDVTTGSYLARKKCMSPVEEWLARHFKEHKPHGLVEVFLIRKVDKPTGITKTQAIEKCYDTNLLGVLNSRLSIDQKYHIFKNLLMGLKNLHSIVVPEVRFQVDTQTYRVFDEPVFHFDISPNNIFASKSVETGSWEAVIGDFGFACTLAATGGTLAYRPPETLRAERNPSFWQNTSQIIHHNRRYGQKKDIWAMGLVLATLLAGHFSQKLGGIMPPLPALEACFLLGQTNDEAVANLQQDDITRDIDAFKAVSDNLLYNKLWDIVALMLRVNPDERKTAQELYVTLTQKMS